MLRRFAATAALVVFISGCGKIKKTSECNAFIDKVNASLKEIEKHTSKGENDAQTIVEMKKLGELYEQLAKDVGALEITTPELKQSATEYQQMAQKAAETARDVATAIETKNPEKAEKAQGAFDQIVKREDELVSKINSFCQAP